MAQEEKVGDIVSSDLQSLSPNPDVFQKVAECVHDRQIGEASGHDWWHTFRVTKIAQHLYKAEGGDPLIVELAALLHDIADYKFNNGDDSRGPAEAENILTSFSADEQTIRHVCLIIGTLSYKGANVATPMSTLEGKIVQDADRLDAIGAIGIARTFAYGGYAGRPIYDPNVPPVVHESAEAYKSANGTSVNHFHEKLLLLHDRMNTSTGRTLAEKRQEIMKTFLCQFYGEWDARLE